MNVDDIEVEKLNQFKTARDLKSLLREYRLICISESPSENFPFFESPEFSPFVRNYAFNLIKGDLDSLERAWQDFDLADKEHAVHFLEEVGTEHSLSLLGRCLLREGNQDIQFQIIEILRRSEILGELKIFFYDAVTEVMGRKLDVLLEVLCWINDPRVLRTAFHRMKRRCPLGHDSCSEDIFLENAFFVGQPF